MARIRFRKDRGTYYLIDGSLRKSLRTDKKGIAEALKKKYEQGKFGLTPTPTVGEFYERWIARQVEPLVRRALARDYRQHFRAYILPEFANTPLSKIGTGELTAFQLKLIQRGLSVKTARNIIDASFRAMFRDARAEISELEGRDPFIDVKWPKNKREAPDPFTAEERDRILRYTRANFPLYLPWLYFQFHTGARPSESCALRIRDVDFRARTVSINKSRHLKTESATKTEHSKRIITVSPEVIALLEAIRLPWETPDSFVFYNSNGDPIDPGEWARYYWPMILAGAEVRYRKFYATRHTFITEAIKARENVKAVADYCGTSLAMIQNDYCARLELASLSRCEDRTVLAPEVANSRWNMASPTGFEPVLSA